MRHQQNRKRKQQWNARPGRKSAPRSSLDWLLVLLVAGAVLWQVLPQAKGTVVAAFSSPEESAAVQASTYFANCDAARAAGAAPMSSSEPGYRDALDRDDDGIACEPYYGR